MKAKTLKGILIALAVCVAVAAVIVLASHVESGLETETEGAGSTTYTTVRAEDEEAAAALSDEDDAEETGMISYNGQKYYAREGLSTLLIMGIDDVEVTESESYRNSSQADFLLLAVFDDENKTCTLLQINRDTMSDVPVLGVLGDNIGVTTEQIALAHTYGSGLEDSCENTVDAVSDLLYGTEIDNYLSLTMGAISVLNDLVGGVTVTIEDDFTGVDDTLVMGETVTLMGEHAENYVRARYTMTESNTNEERMRRQRTYMLALVDQLKAAVAEDSDFVLTAYAALADYLVTDCDVNELSDYSEQLTGYTLADILATEGESVVGEEFMEFYVDEDALRQMVIDLFYVQAEE